MRKRVNWWIVAAGTILAAVYVYGCVLEITNDHTHFFWKLLWLSQV